MTEFVAWEDVKARKRAMDPRSDAEYEAALEAARAKHAAYIRGYQLAEMRKAAQLTQKEVADILGVTQARVSKIEAGEISGVEAIRDFVAALGGQVEVTATLGTRSWRVA